jgi:hypothetical protein
MWQRQDVNVEAVRFKAKHKLPSHKKKGYDQRQRGALVKTKDNERLLAVHL